LRSHGRIQVARTPGDHRSGVIVLGRVSLTPSADLHFVASVAIACSGGDAELFAPFDKFTVYCDEIGDRSPAFGVKPPDVRLEFRAGSSAAVDVVAAGLYAPPDYGSTGQILTVQGPLVEVVEIWARSVPAVNNDGIVIDLRVLLADSSGTGALLVTKGPNFV
jgi:hypothetical protein